jgi:hypothetical protein
MEHKFVRDDASNAIINTDADALTRYKARKMQLERVSTLEREMSEMKSLLLEINSKLTGK